MADLNTLNSEQGGSLRAYRLQADAVSSDALRQLANYRKTGSYTESIFPIATLCGSEECSRGNEGSDREDRSTKKRDDLFTKSSRSVRLDNCIQLDKATLVDSMQGPKPVQAVSITRDNSTWPA